MTMIERIIMIIQLNSLFFQSINKFVQQIVIWSINDCFVVLF